MTTPKDARKKGKLSEFVKERDKDPRGAPSPAQRVRPRCEADPMDC